MLRAAGKFCGKAQPAIAAMLLTAASASARTPPPVRSPPFAASAASAVLPIPRSRVAPSGVERVIPAPKRFVTRHTIQLSNATLAYTAIAGETYLYNNNAEPIGSIFSFSYIKGGPSDPNRPVLFVFNGGPGSSSIWLHMGVVGPRRVVLDHEVNPSNTPPFGIADNPKTLLDVADLVFIDPIGTGWSRLIGKGSPADFWGVDEDADATAQFMELWLTEHQRWNSPKYVMGESYGSIRAALLPRALMGSPIYGGTLRGITLNGVITLGTTLEARGPTGEPKKGLPEQALRLPAQADTAWYHHRIDRRGRSLEAFHEEVKVFAAGPYLAALTEEREGVLPLAARAALVMRLVSYTGLPADAYATSLSVSDAEFGRKVLADEGLQVGDYDSRDTLPLAGDGGDPVADDPAMGRYVPGFVTAFHEMAISELKIKMDRPYGAIVWKDIYPSWNWKRAQASQDQSFAKDLAIAMRRNGKMRILVASGYFDLETPSAIAERSILDAKLPADRVVLRRYASGHMLYLGDAAGGFSDDVRNLIKAAQ